MIEIRKLSEFTQMHLRSLGHNGYVSNSAYEIFKKESSDEISFSLKIKSLKTPFTKTYPESNEIIDKYDKIAKEGFSFCAHDKDKIAGVIIAEQYEWNNSLNIEFIETAEEYRGKGIGTLLLKHLEHNIKKNNFRIISLETQNTNTAAINFYRKNGYEITGLNLALYDENVCKDEVAFYMTKHMTG